RASSMASSFWVTSAAAASSALPLAAAAARASLVSLAHSFSGTRWGVFGFLTWKTLSGYVAGRTQNRPDALRHPAFVLQLNNPRTAAHLAPPRGLRRGNQRGRSPR